MITKINPISFHAAIKSMPIKENIVKNAEEANIINLKELNELKNKTKEYYESLFSDIQKYIKIFNKKSKNFQFYNPVTEKYTTIYPAEHDSIVSIYDIDGTEILNIRKIQNLPGIISISKRTVSLYDYPNQTRIDDKNSITEFWSSKSGLIKNNNIK